MQVLSEVLSRSFVSLNFLNRLTMHVLGTRIKCTMVASLVLRGLLIVRIHPLRNRSSISGTRYGASVAANRYHLIVNATERLDLA